MGCQEPNRICFHLFSQEGIFQNRAGRMLYKVDYTQFTITHSKVHGVQTYSLTSLLEIELFLG